MLCFLVRGFNEIICCVRGLFYMLTFVLFFTGRVLQAMGDDYDTTKKSCVTWLSKSTVYFVWTTVVVEIYIVIYVR